MTLKNQKHIEYIDELKNRYCKVNHITSRKHRVKDEQGEIAYTKVLRKL